jgi:hypothetical protein
MEYKPELETLKKEFVIENIHYYNLSFENNNLVCTLKSYKTKSVPESLSKSTILSCLVMNPANNEIVSENSTKYSSLLIDIWSKMDIKTIIKNTTFNIKLGDEKNQKGYNYSDKLKFSFQRKDSNATWKEIIEMLELNNFSCEIKIKLENGLLYEYVI